MGVDLGVLRVHAGAALPLRAGFPLTGLYSQAQLQEGHVPLPNIIPQVADTIAFS